MTTSRSEVDQQVAALDELMGEMLVAVATYRDRPVDWDDVEALAHLQRRLADALSALDSARARTDLRRAARAVSITVRRLAAANP